MSEHLIFKYFGYYFSDSQYESFSKNMIRKNNDWIDSKNLIVDLWKYIFESLKSNVNRINIDEIANFIVKVISSTLS